MSKFDTDTGMIKYADLPQVDEQVEIVAGAFKGRFGIVKKAAEGQLVIDTGDSTITVSESACAPKK